MLMPRPRVFGKSIKHPTTKAAKLIIVIKRNFRIVVFISFFSYINFHGQTNRNLQQKGTGKEKV
jgi:hypothetical protein